MRELLTEQEPRPASIEDTVLVISPNIQLIQEVRDFCVLNNMNLWIGNPNSPDVIAIPYKVGIVDREWMDKKSWVDWLDFLRDTKKVSHEHLLIIILPAPFSEVALDEVRKEFEDVIEQLATCLRDAHIVPLTRVLAKESPYSLIQIVEGLYLRIEPWDRAKKKCDYHEICDNKLQHFCSSPMREN